MQAAVPEFLQRKSGSKRQQNEHEPKPALPSTSSFSSSCPSPPPSEAGPQSNSPRLWNLTKSKPDATVLFCFVLGGILRHLLTFPQPQYSFLQNGANYATFVKIVLESECSNIYSALELCLRACAPSMLTILTFS